MQTCLVASAAAVLASGVGTGGGSRSSVTGAALGLGFGVGSALGSAALGLGPGGRGGAGAQPLAWARGRAFISARARKVARMATSSVSSIRGGRAWRWEGNQGAWQGWVKDRGGQCWA